MKLISLTIIFVSLSASVFCDNIIFDENFSNENSLQNWGSYIFNNGYFEIAQQNYLRIVAPTSWAYSRVWKIINPEPQNPDTIKIAEIDVKIVSLDAMPTNYSEIWLLRNDDDIDTRIVDLSTVECKGARAFWGTIAKDVFIFKFKREDLSGVQQGDNIPFKVSGKLTSGIGFSGTDYIRVIRE